jgi:hypothetical protein
MKVRMQDCKNCGKQYGATNGNQSYCCNVCRQQAYYKRHGIDRSIGYVRPLIGDNVNHTFTPITGISDKSDVNTPTKEINPAPVTTVTPLIQHSPKNLSHDNFGPVLEQMNKTHQAQMEAMETRLKLSFAQQLHEQELNARADVILRLEKELKEKENQSDINTSQVLGGLTTILSGIDVNSLIKPQA